MGGEKLEKLAENLVQTQEAQESNSNEFEKINKTIESIKNSQEAEQDRVNEQLQHQTVDIAKTVEKINDVEVAEVKINESIGDLSTTVESLTTKQKLEAEKIMQQQKECKQISQKLEECNETQKQAMEQITIQSSKIDKSLETQRVLEEEKSALQAQVSKLNGDLNTMSANKQSEIKTLQSQAKKQSDLEANVEKIRKDHHKKSEETQKTLNSLTAKTKSMHQKQEKTTRRFKININHRKLYRKKSTTYRL